VEVIMDGRVMGDNISRLGKDKQWLDSQLKLQGYNSTNEIFLGIYHPEDDNLRLYKNAD